MFDDYYEKWQIQKFKRKTEKNLLNLWLQEKKIIINVLCIHAIPIL